MEETWQHINDDVDQIELQYSQTHFSSINMGNVFLTTSMFIPTVYTLAHMFIEL